MGGVLQRGMRRILFGEAFQQPMKKPLAGLFHGLVLTYSDLQ
jgi:hypothetical protein